MVYTVNAREGSFGYLHTFYSTPDMATMLEALSDVVLLCEESPSIGEFYENMWIRYE